MKMNLERKKELLKAFGGITKLKEASVEDLAKVVPEAVAKNVYLTLHEEIEDK